MKKQLLIALGLSFTVGTTVFAQQDPVLMEVDGKKITKSEFLQIYLKNNNNPKYDKQTLDEYIELFKKFQLKVAEAEALGYDTIPKLKRELEGYQKQLAQPYLTDNEMNKTLVDQAYERMKTEVRASHILIKVDPSASPEDTLKAYKRIMAIRDKVVKGEDFAKLAKSKDSGSEDPSAQTNGGDLGYFTAFQMVYPFENAAYNLKVGEVSMPVRTRFGYHILKVTDKRPARGTMKAAHLMIAANKQTDDADVIEKARVKANELYTKLVAGEKFEDLVKAYSDDPSSASNGGVLPLFGTGATTRMIPEFEEAAFSLNKDGDFSKPIQSDFGFHIIKRIELTPLKSFDDLKKEIESRVNRDERAGLTQNSYIEKLKKEYKFTDQSAESIKWFEKNMDSSIYKGTFDPAKVPASSKSLFTVDGKNYTQADFVKYMNENPRLTRGNALNEVAKKAYPEWVNNTVVELEKTKLPVKYPEYKALMNEYHDGILLYEIMSDKVWNKAMKDTVGLKEFYDANKGKYTWEKRYDVVAYESVSPDVAKKVFKLAKKKISSDSISKIINDNTELNLRVRSGKFEVSKTPYLLNQPLKKGVNKPYAFDGKNYVIVLNEVIEAKNKELSEAKGLITSDYQTYLEKEWLKELEQKHKIKINEEVLYSLGK
ncbi:peptidylprolyl isomerase [Crocinitomicaceae bacterium CZZ-1]|uniref:Peptidylprolyl isomerase n=1 Tax=Taishania pollutisoli TaxID=2766479 RepID=A0A8J6P4U2_9FLAO|nr:peptidylprolyl isomerase [Taishania pollutisoli]MBC9811702.1 peptidylprolyl isomerase [Taishania pollutisoli]MBX2948364.1 peptidylprolyl isomerase [Crocinitomicaceae bacterium]NGF75462.1 peptidylprolyl isomerase [Fluviicola sp. SGL-29]